MIWIILIGVIWFVLDCPIFKPWFGIRKPKDHTGHWGE